LDIDTVTLLSSEFSRNGEYIGWSPYFNLNSKETLKASQELPLPTGETASINVNTQNIPFWDAFEEYFDSGLFSLAVDRNGNIITKNGEPILKLDLSTAYKIREFKKFLTDFSKYGMRIPFIEESENVDSSSINDDYNSDLVYARDNNMLGSIGKQLLNYVNNHNSYIRETDDITKEKMTKNYLLYHMFKVIESPANLTESMIGVDQSTKLPKAKAAESELAVEDAFNTPGPALIKHTQIYQGAIGKACVGVAAVSIKTNSTL